MKQLYDLSVPLRENMVTWPGEPGPARNINGTVDAGSNHSETSTLTIGTHTGTHIDAPRHFVPDMADGIETISLEHLHGPCHVWEILDTPESSITAQHLAQFDLQYPKIIFKTTNTQRHLLDDAEFHEDYVCLDISAAQYLVQHGVHLVGIDYLSIERKGSAGHPVHVELLKNHVVNIEGVYLQGVPAGDYSVTALPLRWPGLDGSPTRVLLAEL